MRSLDKYQRYIKQREQTAENADGIDAAAFVGVSPAAPLLKETKKAGAKAAPIAPNETAAEPSAKTRYVLRGGVTVPVSEGQSKEAASVPGVPALEAAPGRKPVPKAVTLPEPELVPNAAPHEETPANTPASLWERLPRHIQLLAQIPAPLEEEVAQKYYTRGFRESREELIERLLDPPLTLEETARVLGVCPATVRRYTNRGVLLHQRTVGQQRRFRLSDVLLFLEKQQNKSASVARPKK